MQIKKRHIATTSSVSLSGQTPEGGGQDIWREVPVYEGDRPKRTAPELPSPPWSAPHLRPGPKEPGLRVRLFLFSGKFQPPLSPWQGESL